MNEDFINDDNIRTALKQLDMIEQGDLEASQKRRESAAWVARWGYRLVNAAFRANALARQADQQKR